MAKSTVSGSVSADLLASDDGLADLARSLLEPAAELLMEPPDAMAAGAAMFDDDASTAPPRIALDVDEIIADAHGEIVVDSGVSELTLTTAAAVVDNGIAESHVTEFGDDVTGFAYLTFDSGIRLYFPDDLRVTLEAPV